MKLAPGLSGFTTRGRCFLAAGVASAACAVGFGLPDLMRVGVLLIVLPFLSAGFVRMAGSRIATTRTVSPQHVPAGSAATVELTLAYESSWPTGVVTIHESVPAALAAAPRYALAPGRRRGFTASYTVRSELRGAYHLGPAAAHVLDPLGLASVSHSDENPVALVVSPRIHPLPTVSLTGAWSGTGDHNVRSFATGSAEDITIREYHYGDDLRRVHWRSSAKAGELMVRREEQPWQARATVYLDNRAHAHTGTGASSSFEWAVELAASAAAHLADQRIEVTLMTADGTVTTGHNAILERLALVQLVMHNLLERPAETGLLVAVLGQLHENDKPALVQLRGAASLGWSLTPADADAAWLGALGFRAASSAPGSSPADSWRRLGNPSFRRGGPLGGASGSPTSRGAR